MNQTRMFLAKIFATIKSSTSKTLVGIQYKTLSEEEKFLLKQEILQVNIKRMIPMLILLILVELSNIVVDKTVNPHPLYENYYELACIFLLSVSAVYLCLCIFCLSSKTFYHIATKFVFLSFWALFSAGTLFFAVMDLAERGSIHNYILLSVICATIPIFTWEQIIVSAIFNGAVAVTVVINLGLQANIIQQILFMTLICTLISQLLRNSLTYAFISQKRAETTNERLKLLNLRLEELSETDALTNLFNRRGSEKRIEVQWEHCVRHRINMALIIADVDLFKMYNDKYGHAEGDECLHRIAHSLKKNAKRSTDIVTRYGGEEFMIVMSNISESNALIMAEKIRKGVEDLKIMAATDAISPYITVSIGVATIVPTAGNTFTQLFLQADNALYQAKANGCNRVVCSNKDYVSPLLKSDLSHRK